jgi:D-ribose pyranase
LKKIGILNQAISEVVAGMGHKDKLVIADAGLPIPPDVRRIDLALTEGVPGFAEVVEAVHRELEVESIIVAEEMEEVSAQTYGALLALVGDVGVEAVPHESFKALTQGAKAVIRTGEFTPYANVILVAGVVF